MRNLMIFVQISMSVRQQTLLVQQDIIASTIWEAMLVIVQGDLKARPVKLVSYFISIRGLLNFSTRFIPKRALRGRKWEKSYPWYRATPYRKQHNTFPWWLSLVFDKFFLTIFFYLEDVVEDCQYVVKKSFWDSYGRKNEFSPSDQI